MVALENWLLVMVIGTHLLNLHLPELEEEEEMLMEMMMVELEIVVELEIGMVMD